MLEIPNKASQSKDEANEVRSVANVMRCFVFFRRMDLK